MLNIIICDDEAAQRRHLKAIVQNELELKGLAAEFYEFASGEDFLAHPQSSAANLIFLDIEMHNLDGMATAQALRRWNSQAIIVFVTAYDDYVFQGYDVKALNYILKPYEPQRIKTVLAEALSLLEQREPEIYQVETKAGVYNLPLKNTLYFMSDKRKIIAVTTTEKIDFYGKLDDLQPKLPPYFVRCHRRYLVNLHFVASVVQDKARVGEETLPVSRSHYQELMLALAKKMLD